MAMEIRSATGGWWAKAAAAGIAGGIGMAIYAMLAAPETGNPVWYPINAVASTFFAYRPVGSVYAPNASLAGLVLIALDGAVWGLIYAAVVAGMAPRALSTVPRGLVGGLALGFTMWIISGLLMAPILAPELAFAPPMHYLVAHLVAGATIGTILAAATKRRDLAITFAPEVGVEVPVTSVPGRRDL